MLFIITQNFYYDVSISVFVFVARSRSVGIVSTPLYLTQSMASIHTRMTCVYVLAQCIQDEWRFTWKIWLLFGAFALFLFIFSLLWLLIVSCFVRSLPLWPFHYFFPPLSQSSSSSVFLVTFFLSLSLSYFVRLFSLLASVSPCTIFGAKFT